MNRRQGLSTRKQAESGDRIENDVDGMWCLFKGEYNESSRGCV